MQHSNSVKNGYATRGRQCAPKVVQQRGVAVPHDKQQTFVKRVARQAANFVNARVIQDGRVQHMAPTVFFYAVTGILKRQSHEQCHYKKEGLFAKIAH